MKFIFASLLALSLSFPGIQTVTAQGIDTSKTYNITASRAGCNNILSVAPCGSNLVDLSNVDDGSGRQHFKFVPVPGTNSFNIIVAGGRDGCNVFLSAPPCGSGFDPVDLSDHDDGSGRQRWTVTSEGSPFSIMVDGGRDGCNDILCAGSCTTVDVCSPGDGSGSQQWFLNPVGNSADP
ncbi:Ricin B-type lectin domain-containing protein [Mycena sanguinolenta]|uniref:Ricin B-type lectin domain-containing protein n=1 Tax=Mycena sanguinolenta TaxID=230812 RepID=A0A8H7CPC1_9AGAR|nr:Ricin B-type lectin domain-containing protein [Mycena sanguinolenta]